VSAAGREVHKRESARRREIAELCDHSSSDDMLFLDRALSTGLSGTSPIVRDFEQSIAAHYEVEHVVAVSSGAAAVMVALRGIDVQRGREVIVSPTCPICTVLPLLDLGVRPVFCDVQPDSFGLCQKDLEGLINDNTCAVIETPMWGYPIRLEDTRAVTDRHGLPLILDLAHGHQTRLHGKLLPAYGDISCFSTHECKFLSTGEGGFVMTHDAACAERMRAFSRFGNLEGHEIGLNFKLGGLQAAIGLARMRRLQDITVKRQMRRDALIGLLANPHLMELPIVKGGAPSGYALLIQAVAHDGRELVRYQTACGIPSDILKYDNRPLYEYPILSGYTRSCPNAAALLRSLTTVPLHPELEDDDIRYVASALNAYRPAGELHDT
jgi:perosamine synthetase